MLGQRLGDEHARLHADDRRRRRSTRRRAARCSRSAAGARSRRAPSAGSRAARSLGVQLRQAEPERERRDEDDAAADAEEPGEDAADEPDQRRRATIVIRAADPDGDEQEREAVGQLRTGTRCCSAVPASTPTTAGMPTSAAAPGFTSPCRAYVTAPAIDETRIAASDVAEARRWSNASRKTSSGTITMPPPTPKSAPKKPETEPDADEFQRSPRRLLYEGGPARPARRRSPQPPRSSSTSTACSRRSSTGRRTRASRTRRARSCARLAGRYGLVACVTGPAERRRARDRRRRRRCATRASTGSSSTRRAAAWAGAIHALRRRGAVAATRS